MKDKNGIIHCKTPQEFNRIIGVKTFHPLISVVDFSQIAEYSHPQGWKQDYYVIALCRGNSSCGVKYGRNMYDYSDGTLVFTSPGQTVVFQEYGEPFRPAEKPECIRAGIRVSPILYPPVQTTDGNDAGGISQRKVVPVQRFQGVPDYMLSEPTGLSHILSPIAIPSVHVLLGLFRPGRHEDDLF